MSELPEWLTVGAEVATMRDDRPGQSRQLKFATVERIGKRDIVLSDGQRFNVRTLRRREGGDWGWSVGLLNATDPLVSQVQAQERHQRLLTAAESACHRFGLPGHRADKPHAADVILKLAALTGVEAEIRALFADPATHPPTPHGEALRAGEVGK